MTAGPPSDLRSVPGDDLGRDLGLSRRIRNWWSRWHLVPFLVLMLLVVAATITGAVVRQDLREAALDPPIGATTTGEGLPEVCHGPQPELPADQPWLAQARLSAEQAFQVGMSDAAGGGAVVEGRDGWVFWSDLQANNFSQAVGRRVLSQAEMDAWYASMDSLRDRLGERDIDFVIQIVPAKWSIYPEQLPDWTDSIRGSTTFDYLRYAHPDLPVLDMREGLREAKAEGTVYTPLTSHWTRYGGTQGWGMLADCLGAVDAERYAGLAPLGVSSLQPEVENNEFEPFGYAAAGERDTVPVWAEAPGPMTMTLGDGSTSDVTTERPVDLLELPAHTVTEKPQSETTALIMRDSQGTSIAPGWQSGFAETWQVAHGLDAETAPPDVVALADEHQPDVVIFQLTERHLNFVPSITY